MICIHNDLHSRRHLSDDELCILWSVSFTDNAAAFPPTPPTRPPFRQPQKALPADTSPCPLARVSQGAGVLVMRPPPQAKSVSDMAPRHFVIVLNHETYGAECVDAGCGPYRSLRQQAEIEKGQ